MTEEALLEAVNEDAMQQPHHEKRSRFFQIDFLKTVAIALVVLDHSLTWDIKHDIYAPFWERLAIPLFLIIMGFNLGHSFKYRREEEQTSTFSTGYLNSRVVRYMFPFFVLFVGSTLVGLRFQSLSFDEYIFLGYLPFWGPGNWFIFLLFTSIIVLPLLYKAFTKWPIATLVGCFASELALQLLMYFVFPYPTETAAEAYFVTAIRGNVFFFLPAIGMGLWFSRGYGLFERRNSFLWALLPSSIIFLGLYQFFNMKPEFIRGDYTLIFYPYAAFIFLIVMTLLPQQAYGRLAGLIKRVSKATYHILLFQILYFSIIYFNWAIIYGVTPLDIGSVQVFPDRIFYIPYYIINLSITFMGGMLWYEAERRIERSGKQWWEHLWLKRFLLLSGALFSLILMGVAIEVISEVSGLNEWARTHGPSFILNEITGPGVMANFIAILFFIGLSMYFMYMSFTISDDEIPV